jgi:hypothetical protein
MYSVLKSAEKSLLVSVLMLRGLSGQAQRGTVCVAPNSTEPPKLFSPGQYFWPHKAGMTIDDLDFNERHLVTVTSDGKRLFSCKCK